MSVFPLSESEQNVRTTSLFYFRHSRCRLYTVASHGSPVHRVGLVTGTVSDPTDGDPSALSSRHDVTDRVDPLILGDDLHLDTQGHLSDPLKTKKRVSRS